METRMGQRPRGMTYRQYLDQLPEANVVDPNPQSYYSEHQEEVFRFALTKTTSVFDLCKINANSGAPHQAIALYKQIPPQKYKSAEELIEWATQNSISAPPIELLRQCLEAKDDFQLPKYKEMEKCRPFLIRYMREMGEICTLKFPPRKWESMYAIDYLVEDPHTTQSGAK